MATHSSVLAWRIPGTGESGGLPSMGSHRIGHDWSDLAAAAAASMMGGHWNIKRRFPFVKVPTNCSAEHRILLLLFSHLVVSDSLQPHGLQHTRLPCPSPSPWACSNSCPFSRWWHKTISSSVVPFSSCLQSFPASGSFPKSQFFASGGQSIGASA